MKKYLTGIFFICLFITGHAGTDPIRHYQNIILSSDTLRYPNPNAWLNSDNAYIGQEYYKIYYRTYAYGDTLIYPNPNAWSNSDNAYFGWELYNIYLRTFPGGGGGGSVSIKDSAWLLTGNSGTNPTINYLGTNDAEPLVIKTNGKLSGILANTNTSFGYEAQYSSAQPGNTYLGAYTGSGAKSPASFSTAIGFAAKITASNQVMIGNDSALGTATTEVAFWGALSPAGGGNDGTSGQLLQSNGAGVVPGWINTLANGTSATTQSPMNGSTLIATDRYVDYIPANTVKFYRALGWNVKGENPMYTQAALSNTYSLGSGTLLCAAIWIDDTCTITGINWVLTTAGSYTNASGYNGFGLCKISGSNMTLLDSTTNNTQLFTASPNVWQSTALASTYQATPGLYFLYVLYQETVQVTAPVMAAYTTSVNSGAFYSPPLTTNYFFYGYQTPQTILPATRALTSFTKGVYPIAIYLY